MKNDIYSEKVTIITIKVPTEFDFETNLAYLRRSKDDIMYEVFENYIIRAIPCQDFYVLIKISFDSNQQIICQILDTTNPKKNAQNSEISKYIRDWFDLDCDLVDFYQMANNDPLLEKVVQQFWGLRLIGIPSFFEAMCWGIIGQQINLTFAYTLKRRFIETYGTYIDFENKRYWIFPTAKKIAKLKAKDLTALQFSNRKAEYLVDIANKIEEKQISKEYYQLFKSLEYAEHDMLRIRGIGPWTANYVSMRCLRYLEAFPASDIGLLNAVKYLKGMDRKPSSEELLEIAKSWKNWESYATFYLWRVLY